VSFTLEDFKRILKNLSDERPIFHSEDDMKFALAWEINRYFNGEIHLRLEYPFPDREENEKIDILLIQNGRKIGIELKYLKAELNCNNGGENYLLKEQAANDMLAYRCWKDIERIEKWIPANIDDGYTLWITNNPVFHGPEKRRKKVPCYDQFRIYEGRQLEKGTKMDWININGQRPAVAKGNYSDSVILKDSYTVHWEIYGDRCDAKKNSTFKYCVMRISKSD
jgi:hypothetical protein